MGEAKRRAQLRKLKEVDSRPLKRARFNLYALGTRLALAHQMNEELSHWSDHEERVVGSVTRDAIDQDYSWVLLARDKIGRFRCVDCQVSLNSEKLATELLRERIAVAVAENDFTALGDQGDETNYPTDVLAVPPGTKREDLHPHFRVLIESPGRYPARCVFKEIGPWLAPTDPHFVSEFQFKQFDQRLWEMYLWAAFREFGFDVSQPEAPDFLCSTPGVSFTVEATTVSPSTSGVLFDHPDPKTPEEMTDFLANYMAIKFGSSLTSKLNKKDKNGKSYWERGDASSRPFLLATYTQSALMPYLYGHRVEWEMIDGELSVRAVKGGVHTYKGKSVETGFFDLPGAENVSAVIFSNAGTLAKFDRMGLAAGFIPEKHRYYRRGLKMNSDPNATEPQLFVEELGTEKYVEYWSEEMQIFHNPNAKLSLESYVFMGATQHFVEGGEYRSIMAESTIISSQTIILQISDEPAAD